MIENDFDRILISAVDDGLCLLGDMSKRAILFHLESSVQIKEENIPASLVEFKTALETIFGPGASYFERAIVMSLCEKLGLRFENRSKGFLECVEIAKDQAVNIGEKDKGKAKIGNTPQDPGTAHKSAQFSRAFRTSNKGRFSEVMEHERQGKNSNG